MCWPQGYLWMSIDFLCFRDFDNCSYHHFYVCDFNCYCAVSTVAVSLDIVQMCYFTLKIIHNRCVITYVRTQSLHSIFFDDNTKRYDFCISFLLFVCLWVGGSVWVIEIGF